MRDKRTGQLLVVKKVKVFAQSFHQTFLREISFLSRISHPNIINLKEVVTGNKPSEVYIAMEHMEHEMRRFMDGMRRRFTLGEVKSLLSQLLSAVAALHAQWVIHRDLKTANILYHNGHIKLCDFGEARMFGKPAIGMTPVVQSLRYRAPEVLLGRSKPHPCYTDLSFFYFYYI